MFNLKFNYLLIVEVVLCINWSIEFHVLSSNSDEKLIFSVKKNGNSLHLIV